METKETPNEIIFVQQATFRDGFLAVQDFDGSTTDGYSSLTDLSSTGELPDSLDGISRDLVVAGGNGSWWYDFAVNVYDQDNFDNLLWKFNDVSGDYYLLTMHSPGAYPSPRWHKVSYNSGRPDITRIVIQLSEETGK